LKLFVLIDSSRMASARLGTYGEWCCPQPVEFPSILSSSSSSSSSSEKKNDWVVVSARLGIQSELPSLLSLLSLYSCD